MNARRNPFDDVVAVVARFRPYALRAGIEAAVFDAAVRDMLANDAALRDLLARRAEGIAQDKAERRALRPENDARRQAARHETEDRAATWLGMRRQ